MKRRNEVMVGSVVLLGIVLIIVGTIWLRGEALGRGQIEIRARFNEVGQLLEGNSVKLRGVPIGRVNRIALDSAGRGVIVTMRIDEDARLPEDPVTVLSPESMFGDWQAEIAPRAAYSTYAYAEAPDPDVLPGYSLPDISRLTAVADEIAQNMATLSERVELAFTEETALKVGRSVDNILDASEKISAVVADQQGAIEEVSRDLRAATQTLGRAASTVEQVLTQTEQAISEDRLVKIVTDVERTASRTAALADTLMVVGRDIRQAAATADSALRTVGNLAASVERGEGSVGRLMTDTTLYVSIRESNLELQALLRDIRQNPRKYINVRVF
jgi:phospholipid/cholesterol/gamma-HCH transport system substrate-binding protein